MTKRLLSYILLVGLIGFFSGCEEDGTHVVLLSDPTGPAITTMPDLTLERNNGTDTLIFIGTPVNPGFVASATYALEACVAGDDFGDTKIVLFSGIQDTLIKIVESDLNKLMLLQLDADVANPVDFRIKATLIVDAGTGSLGTSTNPLYYTSPVLTEDVTPYGLPRLDLVGPSVAQKIESPLGDGHYYGYIDLEESVSFTLSDPDAGVIYGGTGGILAVDGDAFVPGVTGWHSLDVSVPDMTYTFKAFRIGLIGDATPNGWSAPDSKMNYVVKGGYWEITLDLVVGSVKFRVNDSWDDGINLGLGDDDHPDYSLSNLWNSGSSKDIPIATAGNYTVRLYIGSSTYSCTIEMN